MSAMPRRDRTEAAAPASVEPPARSPASLIGGMIIAPAFFALTLLVLHEALGRMPGPMMIAAALIPAVMLGIWVRLADL